jgi:hypothetical protein
VSLETKRIIRPSTKVFSRRAEGSPSWRRFCGFLAGITVIKRSANSAYMWRLLIACFSNVSRFESLDLLHKAKQESTISRTILVYVRTSEDHTV